MLSQEAIKAMYRDLSEFERPDRRKAIWQVCNSFLPYFAMWALMIYTATQGYSYWITLSIGILTTPFWVRMFIIFHDCCHGSFFNSHKANRFFGYLAGVLTFTPYEDWQRSHAGHHATSGNLDRRGLGDIWTATVAEYRALPWHKRAFYRLYRNPFVMFGVGPSVIMLGLQRLWHPGARKRERVSVMITNASILAIMVAAYLTFGIGSYIAIQLPIVLLAGAVGVWLFYVQHQFDGADWVRHDEWDQVRAALQGSSYYKLPSWLQWCTGNIGLHHIHHLRPGIPNYNLQQCYDETPLMQSVTPLTLRRSLRSVRQNLWDEKQGRLVSFGELRSLPVEAS